MHAALIGASRGIGYHVTLNLLATSDWTCTLLLRRPEIIEQDDKLAPYINEGKLSLIQGNGTNDANVAKLFEQHVDLLVTTIGGLPRLTWWGIGNDQPTVCTDSTLALLRVLKTIHQPIPRIIAVSSMGMGDNHQHMPLLLRTLYPWFLHKPHLDKEGLEYLLMRSSTLLAAPEAHIPPPDILPREEISKTAKDFVPEFIIVRAAALTGGDSAPKGREATRVGETTTTYQVNRREVARFIVDDCLPGKDEWVNKLPVVGH